MGNFYATFIGFHFTHGDEYMPSFKVVCFLFSRTVKITPERQYETATRYYTYSVLMNPVLPKYAGGDYSVNISTTKDVKDNLVLSVYDEELNDPDVIEKLTKWLELKMLFDEMII